MLSEVYYGDMALRQSGDIDLFVRKRDVARIKSAVRELGYTVRVPIPEDAEEDYIASGYECTFDSPAGRTCSNCSGRCSRASTRSTSTWMDVRAGGARGGCRPHGENAFSRRPVPGALGACRETCLGTADWLYDIAQIMKLGNLNWDWIQAQAREFGIERILHVTLLLANRFWQPRFRRRSKSRFTRIAPRELSPTKLRWRWLAESPTRSSRYRISG